MKYLCKGMMARDSTQIAIKEQHMKTNWDYSELAESYLKRPDYSQQAIDKMLAHMRLSSPAKVCDVGAGVAHLTLELLAKGFEVHAVEPNDNMRAFGQERTAAFPQATWYEGTGEQTGQPDETFDLVTFGSSFNVTDRQVALAETCRILKPHGWFACMWNHRDLTDPIQAKIEALIAERIPGYTYGSRREDQRDVIEASQRFVEVFETEGQVIHHQSRQDCLTAWASHATLQRQAQEKFPLILTAIGNLIADIDVLAIPYTTRIWFAQKK